MRETVIAWFDVFPPEWTTFLIAMLPIIELRGAIPWAIGLGDLTWPTAYVLAVAGNLVPIVPILLYLKPVSTWLRRMPLFDRFFEWLFARTRRRGGVIEKYGPWGLALFVAIPLPVTGGWTGAAAAFVFGIPFRRSFPAITAGIAVAGVIMTLVSLGLIRLPGLMSGAH